MRRRKQDKAMNRTLLAVLLAATALSGAVASAQPKDDKGHGPPAKAQGHGGGAPAPARPAGGGGGQARPQAQAPAHVQIQASPQTRFQAQPARPAGGGGGQARPQAQAPAQARPQAQAQPYRQGGGGAFSYQGRQHDQIRGPSFSYPRGYRYERWGVGQLLPFLFLSSPYWFSDYSTYGFGPPPRGYRWVRYGPDLLLVSRATGRIRQVIYGVFY
jgi:Ni/Co efflux regulator RcnB